MALKSQLLVLFALFLSFSVNADQQPPDCTNRRIHIRRLPPQFNLDLLANCSSYPISGDLCPYLANHGLGPKTHSLSQSWFRTDPLALELIFHRRILEYPCLTPDPSAADAVFLPYYSALDAMRFLYGSEVNSSADHGRDLYEFLRRDNPSTWRRRGGHDHFLVMARPAWDFSQAADADPPLWGTSFLERPEFFNVTALTVEARPWPWQEVAVPYATSFHPPTLGLLRAWQARARRSRRSTMTVFVGGGGMSANALPNIRRSILMECSNTTADVCTVVDCSNGVCEHDPIRYMKAMLKARFCLQPPGDTPTRRWTFDSVIAGCIPVFFEDQSAKAQYTWHLPDIHLMSVTIPKEDAVFRGLGILRLLSNIPTPEVNSMRARLIHSLPRVLYRRHGGSPAVKDAFDISLDGVLHRITDRLLQLGL